MVPGADRARRPTRTSVWLEGRTRVRGRRHDTGAAQGARTTTGTATDPGGLDRGRITEVAVRLLDAEGLPRFSMRRLAGELGVTAMSLYWYVDTKDDLLELVLDRVFGEVRVPDVADEDADWRDQLRALATSYRSVFVRHQWVSTLIGDYLNIGPCATEFSTAVRAVVRRTGLSAQERMGAITAVFQFVYGFGTMDGHYVRRCEDAGLSQDDYYRLAMGAKDEQPGVRAALGKADDGLLEARGGDSVRDRRERDFAFALDLLVAGIEVMAARSAGS